VNLDVMLNRAEHLYQKCKFEEALAQFKVIAREAATKPGVPNYACAMVCQMVHHKIASCLLALDHYVESESEFRTSFRLLQEAADDPNSSWPRGHIKTQLAGLKTDHGRLLSAKHEEDDALAAFDDAQKLYDELISAQSEDLEITGREEETGKQAWENLQIGIAYLARHRASHHEVRHEWAAALKYYQNSHTFYIKSYPSEHEMIAIVALELGRVFLDSALSSMCTRIANGIQVRIGGLMNAAHLNGCIGRVRGLRSGRYVVAVGSGADEKLIKAVNVVSLSSDPGESDAVPHDRLVESLHFICAAIGIITSRHPTADFRTEAFNAEVKALMLMGHPEEALKRCRAAGKDVAGSALISCEHFLCIQKMQTRLEGCPSTQGAAVMLPGASSTTKTQAYLRRLCEGDTSVVLDAVGRRLQLFWPAAQVV
jgi:tetratricopeptide (TPR) repeat protein